jgi:anti-sigma regulatory factor (Ser/Thr protein kinase)
MMTLRGEPRCLEDERPLGLRVGLPPTPEAPGLARAAVAGFFEGKDIEPGTLSTVTLLVSELVSNAVIHPQVSPPSEIVLCVRLLDAGVVRVGVTDQGTGFTPVPRDPSRVGGGYGLYLVDKQATRWGVDRHGGNRVWFELPGATI